MTRLNLSTLLFAQKTGDKLTCCPSLSIGAERVFPDGISKNRPASTSPDKKTKISLIAKALEYIITLSTDPISCAGFDDGVLLKHENFLGYMEGDDKIVCTSPEPVHLCLLLFVYALRHSANNELKLAVSKCIATYNAIGSIKPDEVALVCDSYYYGNFKKVSSVSVQTHIDKQEIISRMRQETLKEINELKGSNVTVPSEITVKKAAPKRTKTKKDLQVLLESCKKGDYLIDYEWDSSQKDYIQSLSSLEGFIPSEEFRMILNKIKYRTDRVLSRLGGLDLAKGQDRVTAIGSDYINLTLCGKPGTGKTKLAYEIGAATGMPVYTIACSHNTDEDEFAGMTKMIDGTPTSVATDTLKCVENGGILLLEEANLPQAAVMMGALGQLVEFPFILKKFGYEPIRRHPLCVIIVTMNTGTAGSKLMSQPFSNRLKQSFCLEDPKKEDFIRILMSNTGEDRDVCRWVYDCYERIVACVEGENGMADSESILLSLSMRTCIGAIENIQEGMEAREAVRNSIIGKIAEQDIDVAKSCDKVLASMKNPDFE